MIEYWLVVMLMIHDEAPVTLEDIRQPNYLTCLNESIKRFEYYETHGIVHDKYNNSRHEAYELSIACNKMTPQTDPL
jgi:hypothetical protein